MDRDRLAAVAFWGVMVLLALVGVHEIVELLTRGTS